MGHVNSVLMALSKCPNPTIFQKSLSVNDFYFGSRLEFSHGSYLVCRQARRRDTQRRCAGDHAGLDLGSDGEHSLDFWLTSEDLPDPNNRVTVDADGKIVLSYKPNNEEGHKRLIAKLKE